MGADRNPGWRASHTQVQDVDTIQRCALGTLDIERATGIDPHIDVLDCRPIVQGQNRGVDGWVFTINGNYALNAGPGAKARDGNTIQCGSVGALDVKRAPDGNIQAAARDRGATLQNEDRSFGEEGVK